MSPESVSTLPTPYERLVKAGREARKHADQYQWVEGDLALEVEHLAGPERPQDPETGAFLPGESALKRYAEDVDINYTTMKTYRSTAAAWPPERRRSGVAFEVHRTLNDQDDRFDLIKDGMTRRDARAIVEGRNRAGRRVPGWFELAGIVGDDLIAARTHMGKVEEAITREPNGDLLAKLELYAGWADEVAQRLRALAKAHVRAA